jgi:hypothetical protein
MPPSTRSAGNLPFKRTRERATPKAGQPSAPEQGDDDDAGPVPLAIPGRTKAPAPDFGDVGGEAEEEEEEVPISAPNTVWLWLT